MNQQSPLSSSGRSNAALSRPTVSSPVKSAQHTLTNYSPPPRTWIGQKVQSQLAPSQVANPAPLLQPTSLTPKVAIPFKTTGATSCAVPSVGKVLPVAAIDVTDASPASTRVSPASASKNTLSATARLAAPATVPRTINPWQVGNFPRSYSNASSIPGAPSVACSVVSSSAPVRYVVSTSARPASVATGAPSRVYAPGMMRTMGPSSVASAPSVHAAIQRRDPNWLEEFTKRVWPSIAEFAGKKMKNNIAAYVTNPESLFREIDGKIDCLRKETLDIPPTHSWLNKVLDIFWPIISKTVDAMVKEKVLPTIQSSVPSFLGSISVDCDFGNAAPQISAFRVLKDAISTGFMDIECDLQYHAKPELTLSVANGIKVGLDKLDFSMTFYVSLFGLLSVPPFFSGMSVYLCRAPAVNTNWNGLIGVLDADFLNSLVSQAVCSAMTRYILPHRMIKLMSNADVSDIIQPRPRGCLHLTFLEAQGLVGSDYEFKTLWTGELTTDPYVRVNMGSRCWRSATIENDVNPVWEEENTCLLLVDIPGQQQIQLSIFDDGIRQQLKQKLKMGDSSGDEVARLGKPMSIAEFLGTREHALYQAVEVERWFDLSSWWAGKGMDPQRLKANQKNSEGDGPNEDQGSSPVTHFFQKKWDWVKDKMDDRAQDWYDQKKQKLLKAEARIKVRAEWKPVGEATTNVCNGVSKEDKWGVVRKVLDIDAAAIQVNNKESSAEEDDDEESSTEEDDETDSDCEFVGWPTYVLSVAIRQIDRLPCPEDDATTTFQVVTDVSRVVNHNGNAINKTKKNLEENPSFTRAKTRAVRPIAASVNTLGLGTDAENEVLAHKVGALLSNDVPLKVIADVLDITEGSVLKAAGNGLVKASKLRDAVFNENMDFFLDDSGKVRITFDILSFREKIPTTIARYSVDIEHDVCGVNYEVDREVLEMVHPDADDARLTASIKVWPLVRSTKASAQVTQKDIYLDKKAKEDAAKLKMEVSVLRIISASGLRKADLIGHSDPYCVVKLGGHKNAKVVARTKVIDNNPDPVWNHGPTTIEWNGQKELKFEVWDEDLVGPGEILGKATLHGLDIKKKGYHTDLYLGDGNGTLKVEVAPAAYKKRPDGSLYLDVQKVDYKIPDAMPIIEVTVCRAEGLRGANRFGGKSDPYVICTLTQKQTFRTHVIDDTLNPTWNYGPEEMVMGPEATKLTFEVRDKDLIGSKPLGRHTLSREKCLRGQGVHETEALSLGKGNGTLYVHVKQVGQGAFRKQFMKLRISVIRAQDLKDADMFGHSDPYCQVKVRGQTAFQTDVIWDNPNPEWNHAPEAIEIQSYRDLKFDVYDKDLIGKGDFLGSAVVSREMCDNGYEGLLSLGVGAGMIEVKIERLQDDPATTIRSVADAALAATAQKKQAIADVPVPLPLASKAPVNDIESPTTSTHLQRFFVSAAGVTKDMPCSPGQTFGLIRDKISEMLSPASRGTSRSAGLENWRSD